MSKVFNIYGIRFSQPKYQIPMWKIATDTQTHRHIDTHGSEYRGHPLRVSGFFPSTYHQGSVQYDS